MFSLEEEQSGERPISEYFQATANSTLALVKVFVGSDRKLFIFPEALLCDRFKFFKAAFQSGFRESTEKSTDLPEDDPVAFSFVIDRALGETPDIDDKISRPEDIQLALCKAYILADKLGRPDLAKDANNDFRYSVDYQENFERRLVCPRAAKLIYENTSESASIRKTMVQLAASLYNSPTCFNSENMQKWLESATSHPNFHCGIMVSIKNQHMVDLEEEWDCQISGCVLKHQS